jgi:hypothetical protein
MAKARLALRVTDAWREAVRGEVGVWLESGGRTVGARFAGEGETEFVLTGIPVRGGAGQVFTVTVESRNFRPYRFFQMLREGGENTPSDGAIRLAADARRVRGIAAPAYGELPELAGRLLEQAQMREQLPEDRRLLGLRGAALYEALTSLQKACLLNLCAKAGHPSAERCGAWFGGLQIIRQDRCFVTVDGGLPERLRRSERFVSAPGGLHEPLKGYVREDSFKSRDAHGNLQVTFQRQRGAGALAADVDLDEAAGLEHGLEVLRNKITGRRTNPYLMREILLLAGGEESSLNPGYRFLF